MSKDKSETSKSYTNGETFKEHNEIDWSSPNEENGYFPHGTEGSAWWLEKRNKGRVQIAAGSLTSRRVPFLLALPKENPFASMLSDEEWEEARELAEEEHHHRALSMVEAYYEYARFGEDKDLETAVQNTERVDKRVNGEEGQRGFQQHHDGARVHEFQGTDPQQDDAKADPQEPRCNSLSFGEQGVHKMLLSCRGVLSTQELLIRAHRPIQGDGVGFKRLVSNS